MLAVLLALLLAGDYPVHSRVMTTEVPAKVVDVCEHSKARRGLRIPVLCPTRVPAGAIDRRMGAGMVVYLREPRFYLLAMHSNLDPELRRPAEALHWFAGAGTRTAMRRYVFDQREYEQPHSVPKLTRRLTFDGISLRVYRAPRYPRGGMFGGHTLAIARCPGLRLDVLGSAHGYGHEDISIALAVNLASDVRCHAQP